MTTLGILSERIKRLYLGGNPSDDASIDRREIDRLVITSLNQRLKMEHVSMNLVAGDLVPPHAVIATYEDVPVTPYAKNASYSVATLPAQPISLPRNMGIWRITQSGGILTEIVPVRTSELAQIHYDDTTNMKYILQDVLAYEPMGRDKILFYADDTVIGATVDIQLLVVDPSVIGEYDVLPMPADMEMDIIKEVLSILGARMQVEDTTNDNVDEP